MGRVSPIAIDRRCIQDTEQPCPQVGAGLVCMRETECLQHRLLYQIFSLLRIIRHAQCCTIQAIQLCQYASLKILGGRCTARYCWLWVLVTRFSILSWDSVCFLCVCWF